ncbi:MAG: DUF6152 family protein [Gammaproteobacteria bacterium]|jgi:hypothetical protein
MKKFRLQVTTLPGALLISLFGVSLSDAHHSFAQFDQDTQNIISGEVVRWAFNNPHVWLYMNVRNDDGTETLWGFEGSGPVNLLRRNINGRTFQPGDSITLMHCPLRDGRPGGHIGWAQLADGTFIDVSDGGCDGDEETRERWKNWLADGVRSSTEVSN